MRYGLKKRRIRSRATGLILLAVLAVEACAGCGGEYTDPSRDGAVSGGAVSGGSVSGQAVSPENGGNSREERQNANYCTDTNLYVERGEEDEEIYVAQMRLDGSGKKKIEIPDLRELISVEEKGLFCIRSPWNETEEYGLDILCRIPIEKGGDGFDVVRTDQVEEISGREEATIHSVCVDPQYIVYVIGEEVVKYDRRSKQIVSETNMNSPALNIRKCGNYFVLWDGWHDNEILYYQGRDEKNWKKMESGMGIYEQGTVFGQDVFFYERVDDDNIYLCDLRKAESRAFISVEQLEHACTGLAGMKQLKFCGVQDMWYEAGRLYVQCEAAWLQGKEYHMAYFLFSQSPGETEIRYEKEITECMSSRGRNRKGSFITGPDYHWRSERTAVEHAVINDAQCYRIMNGKAFFSIYDYENNRGRAGCYDLNTGEFRWLTKKDREYYETWYEPDGGFWSYGNDGNGVVLGKDPERRDFSFAPYRKEGEDAVRFEEKLEDSEW